MSETLESLEYDVVMDFKKNKSLSPHFCVIYCTWNGVTGLNASQFFVPVYNENLEILEPMFL